MHDVFLKLEQVPGFDFPAIFSNEEESKTKLEVPYRVWAIQGKPIEMQVIIKALR